MSMTGQDNNQISSGPRPTMTPVRQQNQALNILEFKAGTIELKSRPLVVILELTQNCNLSCPMCRQGSGYRRDWDMSQATFDLIAESLFDTAMVIDLRGYGESTLVRNFLSHVQTAADSGAHLRLVTNGQVNKERDWEFLMSVHSSILISCDAADEQLFRHLRQGGTLERLEMTVRNINKYRDFYHVPRNLVSLLSIVSRSNLHDLSNIIKLARRLDVQKVSFFPIQVPLNDGRHLSGDVEGTHRALAEAQKCACELGIELHVGAALDASIALKGDVKKLCMHPWAFAYVSHDGGVGFCDHLIGNRKYVLGNIRDGSFMEIWNNPGFQTLRRSHQERQIPHQFAACRWCYKQRYVDFEHMVHPDFTEHYVSTKTKQTLLGWSDLTDGERLSFLA